MKYVELDDLFRRYEIDNYSDFAESAELLDGHADKRLQVSGNALLLVDLYSDPHNIGYIYIVDMVGKGEWKLVCVHASYQLDTLRNEMGVLVLSEVHYEPIPSKPIIELEILKKTTEERKYELSVLDYNRRFRKR